MHCNENNWVIWSYDYTVFLLCCTRLFCCHVVMSCCWWNFKVWLCKWKLLGLNYFSVVLFTMYAVQGGSNIWNYQWAKSQKGDDSNECYILYKAVKISWLWQWNEKYDPSNKSSTPSPICNFQTLVYMQLLLVMQKISVMRVEVLTSPEHNLKL